MKQVCDNLSIGFQSGNKVIYEKIGVGEAGTEDKIKQLILSETLISLGATFGQERWAIDVACENSQSYLVILDIKQDVTYTYLNPKYLSDFRRDESVPHANVFLCEDMEAYEAEEAHGEALGLVEINGNECPLLHVCTDSEVLCRIVCQFLADGSLLADANWLRCEA